MDHGTEFSEEEEQRTLGGLKRLQKLEPWEEMLIRARKDALKIKEDTTKAGWKQRARKMFAMRCVEVGNSLCRPLTSILASYPRMLSPAELHPFELVVSRLLLSAREQRGRVSLQDAMDSAKKIRRETQVLTKRASAAAKLAESATAADRIFVTLLNDVKELWTTHAQLIIDIRDLEKDLRRVPVLDLSIPSAVLVGSPNVGKSSLVRAISTGVPEVQDYPFTTKNMTMGHVTRSNSPADPVVCQVMDTPGLLPRPDAERNEMELLTLASVQFLPTDRKSVV